MIFELFMTKNNLLVVLIIQRMNRDESNILSSFSIMVDFEILIKQI